MIISCPECNKRFKVDQNLIPNDGRLLQCSNCLHKWHFIIKKNDEKIEEPIISEEVITDEHPKLKKDDFENKIDNKPVDSPLEIINKDLPKKYNKIAKNNNKSKTNKRSQVIKKNKKKDEKINLINAIFILIISFLALLLILDTFKEEFSKFLPFLGSYLDSFYEILIDIKFFINDLFR